MGKALARRSGACCELCQLCKVALGPWEVPPLLEEPDLARTIFVCGICKDQLEHPKKIDPNHWHCLHKSVWSEIMAVQVTSVAMLHKLKNEDWATELLELLYLEPEVSAWVEAALAEDWF
jgi:protein PhnA